ncbi:MAG: NrsF family protein, partial [Acidimicrobiia bacterium]
MATNELISALVRDLRPVSPLPMPRVRVARWAVATGVSTLIAIAVVGLRADLGAVALSPTFQVHALLLVIAAFGSAAVALASAVPGDPTAGWRRAAPQQAGGGGGRGVAAEGRWRA